jgi:hypothetical protein
MCPTREEVQLCLQLFRDRVINPVHASLHKQSFAVWPTQVKCRDGVHLDDVNYIQIVCLGFVTSCRQYVQG